MVIYYNYQVQSLGFQVFFYFLDKLEYFCNYQYNKPFLDFLEASTEKAREPPGPISKNNLYLNQRILKASSKRNLLTKLSQPLNQDFSS